MNKVTSPETISKHRLRAWIRLLRVARHTENQLREFLRVNYETTLPRFDVMAALWRERDGLTMSELSRALLVSNGNATAVVDRLERDGLVQRRTAPNDRRTVVAKLTKEGVQQFERMATAHEQEVNEIFSNLTTSDLDQLRAILQKAAHPDD